MKLEFDHKFEQMLLMLAAKVDKPPATVIVTALGIYDAIVTMDGTPAVIKDGVVYPIDVEHDDESH